MTIRADSSRNSTVSSMRTVVKKWGHSASVRIPKHMLESVCIYLRYPSAQASTALPTMIR